MYARLLIWNLRHHRSRQMLNGFAIALTVSVAMTFGAVMMQITAFLKVESGPTRIFVWPVHGSDPLPMSLGSMLQQIGLQDIYMNVGALGRLENGRAYRVVAEQEGGVRLMANRFPVRPDVFEQWKKDGPTGAIFGDQLAAALNLRVGQTIDLPTAKGPIPLKVSGLAYGNMSSWRVIAHFDYMRELLNADRCQFRAMTTDAEFPRIAREIFERTKSSDTPAHAVNMAQFAENLVRQYAVVPALLGFLGLFLLLCTVLTLANSASISIGERQSQLATLRVMGYRQRTLALLMFAEVMAIGLIGWALAVAVMSYVFRNGIELMSGYFGPVKIEPSVFGVGLAIALVTPAIGALPAVTRALRMPLVDALRETT